MNAPAVLAQLDSGYDADAHRWKLFLACWGDQLKARPVTPGEPMLTVLSKYSVLAKDPQPTAVEVATAVKALEAKLGVAMPRSYADFLVAYRPPEYRPHTTADGTVLRVGMYAPQQVGRLSDLEPELVRIFQQPGISSHAPDADYYRYGIDQDDAAIRTSHRFDAIVVGSHGLESHDLIVLYPRERTADGEMEAAMLMHSGEFRAPSFAELMRQLSHMETAQMNQAPPYAQAELQKSCAEQLKPRNVWWK